MSYAVAAPGWHSFDTLFLLLGVVAMRHGQIVEESLVYDVVGMKGQIALTPPSAM